jgi:hypothetical protein
VLILALESSAKAASAALCRDGTLIAQSWQQSGLTHSRTLLPMVRDLLRNTETDLKCGGYARRRPRPGLLHRYTHRRFGRKGPVLGGG